MGRYSNIQTQKREQFKGAIDEFCTFKWNDLDSWDEFGAFIIADKRGDLKASSGPSFTNNYSKPQFESTAGQLQGITFNTKQISFKVGIYWASMADYRKFLNWLHPYEVADLQFGYDKDYAYFCKLAKIDDASKYVVGHQDGEAMYYFETNLTFELQGEACAHSKYSYAWRSDERLLLENPIDLQMQQYTTSNGVPIKYRPISVKGGVYSADRSWICDATHLNNSELNTTFKLNFNGIGNNYRNWMYEIFVDNNRLYKFKIKGTVFSAYLKAPTIINNPNVWELNIKFLYKGVEYNKITISWVATKKQTILGITTYTRSLSIFFDKLEVYKETNKTTLIDTLVKEAEIYILDNYINTNASAQINGESTTVDLKQLFIDREDVSAEQSRRSDFSNFYGSKYLISLNEKLSIIGFLNQITGTLNYNDLNEVLFSIGFKDEVVNTSDITDLIFTYDSQAGLVYWGIEDLITPVNYFLLWNNQKCIDQLTVQNIEIPGCLNNTLDYNQLKIQLEIKFKNTENCRPICKSIFNDPLIIHDSIIDNSYVITTSILNELLVELSNSIPQINTTIPVTSTVENIDIAMYAKHKII